MLHQDVQVAMRELLRPHDSADARGCADGSGRADSPPKSSVRTSSILRTQVRTAVPLQGQRLQHIVRPIMPTAMLASQVPEAMLRALRSMYGTLFLGLRPRVMPSSLRIGQS